MILILKADSSFTTTLTTSFERSAWGSEEWNIWSAKGSFAFFNNTLPTCIEIYSSLELYNGILKPIVIIDNDNIIKDERFSQTDSDTLDSTNAFIKPFQFHGFGEWINDSVFSYNLSCCGGSAKYWYSIERDTTMFIDSWESH